MLPEEEAEDNENEEGTTEEQKEENNDSCEGKDWKRKLRMKKNSWREEGTDDENEESNELKHRLQESEEKLENSQETEESSVKISELEEITTKPIVEEPHEATPSETDVKESDDSSSSLTLRVVSEDQQQVQIDENSQLMVMNLAGFEPRDVTVRLDGDRVSVRAVRVTEEEGFLSRKESFRSCRVPDRVRPTGLTCTMGPEAKLVITTPST